MNHFLVVPPHLLVFAPIPLEGGCQHSTIDALLSPFIVWGFPLIGAALLDVFGEANMVIMQLCIKGPIRLNIIGAEPSVAASGRCLRQLWDTIHSLAHQPNLAHQLVTLLARLHTRC